MGNLISKEDLCSYYILENHTSKESIEHFKLRNFQELNSLCTSYNLSKNEKFNNLTNRVSKEDLINYYVKEGHSQKEALSYFRVKEDNWLKLLKHYNVDKNTLINDYLNISKEALYKYYIEENHTKAETASYFNCCEDRLNIFLNEYNIIKNRKGLKLNPLSKETKSKISFNLRNKSEKDRSFINKKRQLTCKARYGVSHYSKSALSKKHREELYKNSNKVHFSQDHFRDDFKELLLDKDKSIDFLKINPDMTLMKLKEYFELPSETPVQRWLDKYDLRSFIKAGYSHLEDTFKDFLISLGIKFQSHVRKLLSSGLELDFYIPDKKIAFELNGNYWHSELNLPKNYHFNKSKECFDLGIRLMHIWEYEWLDRDKRPILESLIKISLGEVDTKIYARNCAVREITSKEAAPFNNLNHLQGHRNAQITYGLFYKNILVQLMSFSKTKDNKNLIGDNSWEIIRGCPGSNNIVIGGVSKLFKYFIKEQNPDSIFSYCDFNKFDGKGHEAIGMKFIGYTGPNMKWLLNGNQVLNRKPSKHKELKKEALCKIWESGSKKYLWIKT